MGTDIKVVSQLREQTGAGIGDCKSALEEANGDTDKAIEILRKKGAIKAVKKSDRTTSEGVIAIAKQDNKVAIVGLACETDFVARTDDFVNTVDEFAKKLLTVSGDEFKTWAEGKIKNELIVKIGENIQLVSSEIIEGEVIGTYLHSNKKIVAAVVLSGGTEQLATDLSMQVAAMSPQYLKPEDVPSEVIDKEKEIYQDQLKTEGKPEEVWEKIIPGKINKFYKEVCLLKQVFIKDDKKSVEEFVKEQGEDIEVVKFARHQI